MTNLNKKIKDIENGTKLNQENINSLLISDLFKITTEDENKTAESDDKKAETEKKLIECQ